MDLKPSTNMINPNHIIKESWKLITSLKSQMTLSRYLDIYIAYYKSHPATFRLIAQNIPRQDAQSIPGYDHLANLLAGIREDFEKPIFCFFIQRDIIEISEKPERSD
ncbi:MAG: hypothetical protein NTW65_11315 [Deltaproteobacteria bacterium]|nr:hypothetical protein [Deltaproteobacteria bacterium]